MKKRRFLWLFLLLSITMMARADRGGFYYRHFHVEAFVHKNNVWDITETMDVTFTEPRHGLYRYIPTRFWLKHDVSKNADSEQRVVEGQVVQDWRDFEYQSTVTDANVEGWEYTTEDSDDDNFVVRIGSGDREVMGEQRYVLHYKYTYRDDRYPNFDYLYHTVLGTDFDESIEHFSFHIHDILKTINITKFNIKTCKFCSMTRGIRIFSTKTWSYFKNTIKSRSHRHLFIKLWTLGKICFTIKIFYFKDFTTTFTRCSNKFWCMNFCKIIII